MMETESKPTTTAAAAKKGATEEETTTTPSKPTNKPAKVDVVDKRDAEEKSSFGHQEQTPKHANKTIGGGSRDESSPTSPGKNFDRQTDQKITPDRDATTEQQQQSYAAGYRPGGYYVGAGEAAYAQYRAANDAHFAARLRMMQQEPQQVSPGGGHMAYRAAASSFSQQQGYSMQGGRHPYEGQAAYRQGQFRYDQQAQYRGLSAGQYGTAGSYRGYGDGSTHPQYGQGLPPSNPGRVTHYGSQTPHEHDPRYVEQHGGVTRTVSSSFDRSIKGTENAKAGVAPGQGAITYYSQHAPHGAPPIQDGGGSVASDDDSWRQLNQVASVDNDTMIRARLVGEQKKQEANKTLPSGPKGKSPPSNSSSLTNSPTEGHSASKANAAPSKHTANLDSLSSVASEQEPIDTVASKDGKVKDAAPPPPSPGSSQSSLDLMKCHSGSSGLLHHFPGHGRSMSGMSFQAQPDLLQVDSKRSREDRGDSDTKLGAVDDSGRLGPPSKKGKVDDKAKKEAKADSKKGDKKGSPLPVECSPPDSSSFKGSAGERPESAPAAATVPVQAKAVVAAPRTSFNASPAYMGGSYFDRAPSYTYSIDSAPSREYVYPPLPRAGSSSSSTITPAGSGSMQIEGPIPSGTDGHPRDAVGTLPSWDIINAQDSFGAGSLNGSHGGAPIVGNFSFSQDYGTLATSGSNLGHHVGAPVGQAGAPALGGVTHMQDGRQHGPPTSLAESRNQSFEGGGHFHGSVERAAAVQAQLQQQDASKVHPGPFPPHVSSWGTASTTNSTQQTYAAQNYSQYRQGGFQISQARAFTGAPVLRNYSEDSAARTSPPTGVAASFQPPPEFKAPQAQMARRPPPAVYIMSSAGRDNKADTSLIAKSASGVYGWSQEEDDRLTEVMKKYKNPRDWDPIAKQHGFGKTPKECHERWIRYLKPGVRKGQWQDHEDAIVVEAVSSSTEQPFTRWSDLAQKLPGRVGKQIRDRWVNHLNPNINHMPFSREDDLLLWEGHKQLGKRWVEISTKFFKSSRSENHIKNRWYSASFKKFISNEFGPNAHSGSGKSKTGHKGSAKKRRSM